MKFLFVFLFCFTFVCVCGCFFNMILPCCCRGKDVLQKPELKKALDKRKDTQKKKEWEQAQASKRTSLELKLEQQAKKLHDKDVRGIDSRSRSAPL